MRAMKPPLLALAICILSAPALAQSLKVTPTKYIVSVEEIDYCQVTPTGANGTCYKVHKTDGTEYDIAAKAANAKVGVFGARDAEIPAGTYNRIKVVVKRSFKLQGKKDLGNGKTCVTGGTDTLSAAQVSSAFPGITTWGDSVASVARQNTGSESATAEETVPLPRTTGINASVPLPGQDGYDTKDITGSADGSKLYITMKLQNNFTFQKASPPPKTQLKFDVSNALEFVDLGGLIDRCAVLPGEPAVCVLVNGETDCTANKITQQ